MSAEELEERADWYQLAVQSERERIKLYSELPGRLAYLFSDDESVEYEAKAQKNALRHSAGRATLQEFRAWLETGFKSDIALDELRGASKDWVTAKEIGFGLLFQPLRCVLTGAAGGADLFDSIGLLGPAKTLARIDHGLRRLWG